MGQFVVRAEQLAQLYPTDRVEVLIPVPSAELFALDLPDGDAPAHRRIEGSTEKLDPVPERV